MSEAKICHECGQRVRKLNPHRMDRSKVQMLELLVKARAEGNPWVKLQEGSGCEVGGQIVRGPYLARVHANRLVWFGLAKHGEERSGMYAATSRGLLFLLGKETVPETIWCKDGIVVKESETQVLIGAVKGVVLDKPYWDAYALRQRYPEEVAA